MRINFPDQFFSKEETNKLIELLNIDKTEFESIIEKICYAAMKEYLEMFLGMGMPSRADEIRQHRLRHLIQYFFCNRLPSEAEVSAIFQLTQSRSRSLLQQTLTRFHFDLNDQIIKTLKNTIENFEYIDDTHEYRIIIQSDNVLERLNRIIAIKAPKLDPIKKVRNMARTYSISEDSYELLHSELRNA
ncbi:MAG: hypothetical protein ACTSQ8_20345 [Candidatus Helarchaeota archaeon]